MKLATNSHRDNCWKGFQGQKSKVNDIARLNALFRLSLKYFSKEVSRDIYRRRHNRINVTSYIFGRGRASVSSKASVFVTKLHVLACNVCMQRILRSDSPDGACVCVCSCVCRRTTGTTRSTTSATVSASLRWCTALFTCVVCSANCPSKTGLSSSQPVSATTSIIPDTITRKMLSSNFRKSEVK